MWVIFAIILSTIMAACAEANRYFQMDGFRLNFWRVVVMTGLLLPVCLVAPWPEPSLFYVAAVFTGVVVAISPTIRLSLSARKMGRVSTLFMPVEALVGFMLWMLVDPNMRETLLSKPLTLGLVLLSFIIISGALATIRRNDAGWTAFLIVAPLGVLHALSGVLFKFSVVDSHIVGNILIYILVANMVAIILCTSFLAMQKDIQQSLCPPGMMRAALFYGVLGVMGQFFFFSATSLAPNPGYVVAIVMLAPAWILLYKKIRKLPDDASPIAGMIMVAGAILLVLVTL